MSSLPDRRTANEQLAEIIASTLVEAGLVSSSRIEELKRIIASGTARPDDWRHWIESARSDAERGMQGREPGVEQ